ncbi:Ig-like domain-containing protein [Yersinia sp. 2466 StPb PI]|uniref:Ig-like domain-containing protein n=1 Tax=Yersinia sp. 2466 StPb PI TaxID=3061648 RepID=UPI00355BDBC8
MQEQHAAPTLPCRPVCLTLSSTSNAKADGYDTNSATAVLTTSGTPLCGYQICFTLSGGALFCDGSNRTFAVTDACGVATVTFTDRQAETVCVSSQYENINALSYSTFDEVIDINELSIIAFVQRDNAQASPSESNIIVYTLWNDVTNQPVPSRQLTFSTYSSTANLSPSSPQTDTNGQIVLTISNSMVEDIEIAAYLLGNTSVNNYTLISFFPVITHYITAQVLTSGIVAPGGTHTVRYTLRNTSGAIQPGRYMSFRPEIVSTNPADIPVIIPGYIDTNLMGQITINVTSPVRQQVRIVANYTDGNADNDTYLDF